MLINNLVSTTYKMEYIIEFLINFKVNLNKLVSKWFYYNWKLEGEPRNFAWKKLLNWNINFAVSGSKEYIGLGINGARD